MGTQYTPTDMGPGIMSMAALNGELESLRDALERAVSRYEDPPNAMQADLDGGGHDLINWGALHAGNLVVAGDSLIDIFNDITDMWEAVSSFAQEIRGILNQIEDYYNDIMNLTFDKLGYDIAWSFPDLPDGVIVGSYVIPANVTILYEKGAVRSAGRARTAPASTAVAKILKNNSEMGTATVHTDGSVDISYSADWVAEEGDVVQVRAPTPKDSTLSDLSITLSGRRTVSLA